MSLSALLEQLLAAAFRAVNRSLTWFRLPVPLAVMNLVALRVDLRRLNLFDTETTPESPPPPPDFDIRHMRTADGSFNDLTQVWMGRANTRFGRNAPIAETFGEMPPRLYEPNPRLISRELLARREFIPATSVNVLLPAWLQFMVHDWLSHGKNDTATPPLCVPLPPGDDWPRPELTVLRTCPDSSRGPADQGRPATYRNAVTHWWDGSQIYGSDVSTQQRIRRGDDGKLHLTETRHLPPDPDAPPNDPELELAGINGNWWIGLSAMHTLFAREHNAIVDRLRAAYPDRDGEWLFQKARLVNAALIAKIHAVEWTPALLQTPALQYAMRAEWYGILGEVYFRAFGRPLRKELLSGIPNSPQEHYAAPYAITEEFTAVYRLHSLLPDDFSFRRHSDDGDLVSCTLADTFGGGTTRIHRQVPFEDVLYSLGTSYSGAPVLHNYPHHLRRIPEKPEEDLFNDVATIDILRDRERGVPRYCAFRRMLRMSVPKNFQELTDNKDWQRELAAIYGEVENVDLLTGTLAETKPPGFAISDTAFRIFIVMAGRRIKSDRFLTDDFTREVYTPAGIAWVEDNLMRDVLLRHAPALEATLRDVRNSFFPWPRAAG
ncbi:MAG: peroxidase family protein [Xanthobacteraceae bacterium]